MKLQENVIVITGGSSGIGMQLAKMLTHMNNTVIICGRSKEKLEYVQKEIPSCMIYQCDVSQQDERKSFVSWIKEKYPQCNILINNAAIAHTGNFFHDNFSMDLAQKEIATNLLAPLELTKEFTPIIAKNQNARIIFVTTGLVYAPRAVYPIYCATKSALHSFTQSLRFQVGDLPISIHEVLMPAVNTPFHQGKPPKIAISVETAVSEMCKKLEKEQLEIRIGGVNLLYIVSRIAPSFALQKVNAL